MVQFRVNMLNAGGSQTQTTAKVAAFEVQQTTPTKTDEPEMSRSQTYAERVANSPPMKQTTTRCGVCESYHETVDCATFAKMDADTKVKKLKEKNLCFHCLHGGHEARTCPEPRPKCLVCHKPHHTVLHGRSFPVPAQRLSARATPFTPAPTSSQHQASSNNTSSTTQAKETANPL